MYCRQMLMSKQANHCSYFLLQLEMIKNGRKWLGKKSTCKISSHDRFLASSHIRMLWTSLRNTDVPLMLLPMPTFALPAPATACQLYQLASKSFRAFDLWMGKAFKNRYGKAEVIPSYSSHHTPLWNNCGTNASCQPYHTQKRSSMDSLVPV